MNLLFFLLPGMCPLLLCAQITDDFSDGNFSHDPTWSGTDTSWTVENGQLRSNGPAVTGSVLYLSTASTYSSNCQWEFFVNPKLATSANNYAEVALLSNQPVLSSSYQGYFIRIGGTPDEVSLFRRDGATVAKIIDGTDGLIASSSSNPTRVKVARTAAHTFTLWADNTGTGMAYQLQGTITDSTYTFSTHTGMLVTYSSANSQRFFFDDFYAGDIVTDTVGPVISGWSVLSGSSLAITFSEPVSVSSAENRLHYSISNGLANPLTATRQANGTTVMLSLAGGFVSGTTYQATVSNVSDLHDNRMAPHTFFFHYYQARYRDVVINELLPDPVPSAGLPEKEFIELLNTTAYPIDLSGWTIGDPTTTATMPAYVLPPGGFVILCATGAAGDFASYGPVLGIAIPATLLNNTGDVVTLKDAHGNLLDQVAYSDTWYGDPVKKDGGFSLEQVNPVYPCRQIAGNWRAAVHPTGGTPGARNSVYSNVPDTLPAAIRALHPLDENTLLLVFSKQMDSFSVAQATYTLAGNSVVRQDVLSAAADSVLLTTGLPFTAHPALYRHLSLSVVSDCWGNTIVLNDSFLYDPPLQPNRYEIVIHELLADPDPPAGLPDAEFIELYNRSGKHLSLHGCKLWHNNSVAKLPNISMPAGSYLVLCRAAHAALFEKYGKVAGLADFPSLANDGAELVLTTHNDSLLHRVRYSKSYYTDGFKAAGGFSLEMVDAGFPCNEQNNWVQSNDPSGGTPGKANTTAGKVAQVQEPLLQDIYPRSSLTVLVRWHAKPESSSFSARSFKAEGLGTAASVAYTDRSYANLLLTFSNPMQPGHLYTLEATGISDCNGKEFLLPEKTARFGLPADAAIPQLLINEVLFDPRSGGQDFVEIYNPTLDIADLKGLKLANTGSDNEIREFSEIAPEGRLLMPGDHLVCSPDTRHLQEHYTVKHPELLLQMRLPSYPDHKGTVVLLDSTGNRLDQLTYSDKWHFPLLDDKAGVSLERIDPRQPTQDADNWHSATQAAGFATPTSINSQFHHPREAAGSLWLDPETFSPDHDGYNDRLFIRYRLERPGYMGTVRIFDRAGREAANPAKNEYLSAEGYFGWDGLLPSGKKAPVGIYVVVLELFHLDGTTRMYKKACVLAGELP